MLYVALGVFAVVVLVQFVITLITGSSNSKLLSFSDVLGQYIFQCVQFESFVSESKPFPFDDFPESSQALRKLFLKKAALKQTRLKQTVRNQPNPSPDAEPSLKPRMRKRLDCLFASPRRS